MDKHLAWKRRVSIPVLNQNICLDGSCPNRQSPGPEDVRLKTVVFISRLLSVCLLAAFIGATVSQAVFAQNRFNDREYAAVQEISDLKARVKMLEQNELILQEHDRAAQETINRMVGIGIAISSLLGFLQLIQILAGREMKRASPLSILEK